MSQKFAHRGIFIGLLPRQENFLILSQPVRPLSYGTSAMRHNIFHGHIHLRKGLRILFGYKDGIPAKAELSGFGCHNVALAFPREEYGIGVRGLNVGQRTHGLGALVLVRGENIVQTCIK